MTFLVGMSPYASQCPNSLESGALGSLVPTPVSHTTFESRLMYLTLFWDRGHSNLQAQPNFDFMGLRDRWR